MKHWRSLHFGSSFALAVSQYFEFMCLHSDGSFCLFQYMYYSFVLSRIGMYKITCYMYMQTKSLVGDLIRLIVSNSPQTKDRRLHRYKAYNQRILYLNKHCATKWFLSFSLSQYHYYWLDTNSSYKIFYGVSFFLSTFEFVVNWKIFKSYVIH